MEEKMNKPKIALLIDLGSLKVSCEGYQKLAAEIENDYEIAYVKFYSYVAKRNRDFNEFIAAKGYDAVTPVASKKRNRLDSRQIIDGTKLAAGSTIEAVALAYGEGDILPIVTELKQSGKDVLEIGVEKGNFNSAFNGFIPVDISYLREGYAAPTTKKAPKAPKKVREQPKTQYAEDIRKVLSSESILARYKK